eukprot:5377448-Pleurochrysis_carterae.AAC.2
MPFRLCAPAEQKPKSRALRLPYTKEDCVRTTCQPADVERDSDNIFREESSPRALVCIGCACICALVRADAWQCPRSIAKDGMWYCGMSRKLCARWCCESTSGRLKAVWRAGMLTDSKYCASPADANAGWQQQPALVYSD